MHRCCRRRTIERMGTVLVTGGSGFIGSFCILQLLSTGHHIRTTVRNLTREGDVRALLKAGGPSLVIASRSSPQT
jgi:nucleoside-diphosphate-sugar epimerase